MTNFFGKGMLASVVLVIASTAASFGQVPTRTLIHFTISVPVAVTIGNYLLAPGTYVLYQDSQVPDRFALYRDNLTKAPIAQITTTQTPYWAVRNDRQTRIELRMAETPAGVRPVVKGFNVPFADRWNIVSVVAKRDSAYITRIR